VRQRISAATSQASRRNAQSAAGFVTGHDFSRADKVNQINGGLQPLQKLLSAFRLSKSFFRSL
jgi:hypothetical protein